MKTKGASDNLLSAIEHTYPKFVWGKLPYFPLSCSGTRTRPWYNNWLPYLSGDVVKIFVQTWFNDYSAPKAMSSDEDVLF